VTTPERTLYSHTPGSMVLVQGHGLCFVRAHARCADGQAGLVLELAGSAPGQPWLLVFDASHVGPWPPAGLRTLANPMRTN